MKKPCWRLHGDIFIVVILFLVSLSTYFSLTPAFCATLHVPAEYSSIRAAMEAAINGDIILVADGKYTGPDNKNLDYQGKAITVQSERGPANCIIDCEGSGRAFSFVKGEGKASVLSGFTISNGREVAGGAVYIDAYKRPESGLFNPMPVIKRCVFKNNSASGGVPVYRSAGGAIYCNYGSITVSDCTFINNRTSWLGGAVKTDAGAHQFIRCHFEGNSAEAAGGAVSTGAAYAGGDAPSFIDCTFTRNHAPEGGGLYTTDFATVIRNCTFEYNTNASNGFGGAISCRHSKAKIENCIIRNNSGGFFAGGIFIQTSAPTITNSVISDNRATYEGSGIYIWESTPIIVNCTITRNEIFIRPDFQYSLSTSTENNSGGGIYCLESSPNIINTIVWGNLPDEIYADSLSSPIVDHSDVGGGWNGNGSGNINQDPLFKSSDDYHLRAGSPCIDTGADVTSLFEDIEGDERPYGYGYDMGCDEWVYESGSGGHDLPFGCFISTLAFGSR